MHVSSIMRLTEIKNRPAVILWLKKALMLCSGGPSAQQFRSAIKKKQIGTTQEKKDMLKEGSLDISIKRGSENTVHQSCASIFIDDRRLPLKLLDNIKKGAI